MPSVAAVSAAALHGNATGGIPTTGLGPGPAWRASSGYGGREDDFADVHDRDGWSRELLVSHDWNCGSARRQEALGGVGAHAAFGASDDGRPLHGDIGVQRQAPEAIDVKLDDGGIAFVGATPSAVFDALDRNHDGVISHAEWEAAMTGNVPRTVAGLGAGPGTTPATTQGRRAAGDPLSWHDRSPSEQHDPSSTDFKPPPQHLRYLQDWIQTEQQRLGPCKHVSPANSPIHAHGSHGATAPSLGGVG